MINRSEATVLAVGGCTQTRKWIRIQRQAEKYKDFLAIRATIDFEAGSIKELRGERSGFEWLHRLLSEPQRL